MRIGTKLAALAMFSLLALAAVPGCKKELTVEDCKAKCKQVGDDFLAKCQDDKAVCEAAKKKGDEDCNKTCDLAFKK